MAVRTPLKIDPDGLIEMTTNEIDAIKAEAIRQYGLNPSVTLSIVASGGSLGTMTDTRLQAGAGITRTDRFATEAELDDVSSVSVDYSKIDQSVDTSESLWTNATYAFPLYYDGDSLVEMSVTDFYDTFIADAITSLTQGSTGTDQAGTYFISTTSTVAGATEVSGSATPVFIDTRADLTAYSADGLIETQDQPTDVVTYYLMRIDAASKGTFALPVTYTKSDINLQETPEATLQDALATMIRYYVAEVSGSQITYNIDGSGTNRGSAMVDTTGTAGDYVTYQVDDDDYRAQIIPDYEYDVGTTASTYNFRINLS